MAEYQAPLRDIRIVLNEVFEAANLWQSLPGLEGAIEAETAEAMLEEAGKTAPQTRAPPNRNGDEQRAARNDGHATAPDGLGEAQPPDPARGRVGAGR